MEGQGPSTPSYNPGEQGDSISSCWHSFQREPWEATGTFLSKKEAIKTPSESKNKTLAWEELKKKKRLKVVWESHCQGMSHNRSDDKGPWCVRPSLPGPASVNPTEHRLCRGLSPRTPEPMTAVGTHLRAHRGACLFPLLGEVNGRM